MKKRVLMALVIALLVFAAVYASAASLNVFGGTLQAGSDLDLTCTESVRVLGWGLETDDNTVRSVRLSSAPATCDGAQMFVRVRLANGTRLAVGDVELDSTNAQYSFPITPWQNPVNIVGIEVVIEGEGS